jgi:hypothetical protein
MLLGRTSWWRECIEKEILHLMADRKQRWVETVDQE